MRNKTSFKQRQTLDVRRIVRKLKKRYSSKAASKWAVWRLPSVVLGVEQEVGADDGDADGDDAEDEEDQQHEAVHVVDLVRPERRENKVPAKRVIKGKQ